MIKRPQLLGFWRRERESSVQNQISELQKQLEVNRSLIYESRKKKYYLSLKKNKKNDFKIKTSLGESKKYCNAAEEPESTEISRDLAGLEEQQAT